MSRQESSLPDGFWKDLGSFLEESKSNSSVPIATPEPKASQDSVFSSITEELVSEYFMVYAESPLPIRDLSEAIYSGFSGWQQGALKGLRSQSGLGIPKAMKEIDELTLETASKIIENKRGIAVREFGAATPGSVDAYRCEELAKKWTRAAEIAKAASEIREY